MMKKYLYALIALLVAVPLLFALTGCGSSGGGGGASAKRVAKVEIDTDGNGTANNLQVYVYNSSGALANITTGTVNYVRTKTWSGGNLTNITYYTNNSEYPNTTHDYTYPGGVKDSYIYKSFNVSTGALTGHTEYTYDSDGNTTMVWWDSDLDEAITAGDNFRGDTYAFGNQTARQEWTSVDTNNAYDSGTDTLTVNLTYTYNASGITLFWTDVDLGEAFNAGDTFASFAYNSSGQIAQRQWTSADTNNTYDTGTDILDDNKMFEVDANGNRTLWYDDDDNDEAVTAGGSDLFRSYTYDASGNKTAEMRWTSGDTNSIYNAGTDTLTSNQTWVYNSSGQIAYWDDADLSEDDSIGDHYEAYTYDANDNELTAMGWTSGDTNNTYDAGTDTLDWNEVYTYNSDGNYLTYWWDNDGSGDASVGDWFEVATYDSNGKGATLMGWDSGDANTTYDDGTDILDFRSKYTPNACDEEVWPDNYVVDWDYDLYERYYEYTYDSACNETMYRYGDYTSIENFFYNATGIIGAEADNDYTGTDTTGDVTTTATYDPTCKDFASVVEDVNGGSTTGEEFSYDVDCEETEAIAWTDGNANDTYDAGEADEIWRFSFTTDGITYTFLREMDPDTVFNMGDTNGEITESYNFISEDILNSIAIWTDVDGSGDVNAGDTTTGTDFTWSGSQVVNALDWTDANDNGIYNTGEESQLTSYDYTGSMINGVIYDLGADGWNDGDMADLYTFTGSRVATYKRWEEAGGDTVYDTNDIGTGINFTYGACGHATRTEWTDADGDAALDSGEETKVETVTCEGGKQTAAPPEDEMWSPVPLPELPSLEN